METDDGRARQVRLEGQAGRTAERQARPGGAMRRSRLIERSDDAPASCSDGLGARWEDGTRSRDLDRGWLDGGGVQPDHSSVMVRYFGAVVFVRLEVPMGDGVRMIKICFVNVLNGDNWQAHYARREHASNRRAPE